MSNIPTDAEYIESKKKPITDEKLAELDDWYSKCKSNSLMFCDADYLAIRERLRLSEKERDSLNAERLLLVAVAEAAEDINKMLSCIDPPDLETATNTTLALEESLTRWHCR